MALYFVRVYARELEYSKDTGTERAMSKCIDTFLVNHEEILTPERIKNLISPHYDKEISHIAIDRE